MDDEEDDNNSNHEGAYDQSDFESVNSDEDSGDELLEFDKSKRANAPCYKSLSATIQETLLTTLEVSKLIQVRSQLLSDGIPPCIDLCAKLPEIVHMDDGIASITNVRYDRVEECIRLFAREKPDIQKTQWRNARTIETRYIAKLELLLGESPMKVSRKISVYELTINPNLCTNRAEILLGSHHPNLHEYV